MVDRILCEQIPETSIPYNVRQALAQINEEIWNVSIQAVVDLRSHLLLAQKYRCAYCQVTIAGDQGGLRELDHVLPKEMSGYCDSRKSVSCVFKNRRHTVGYWDFAYEWRNLVVTCKQCNTNKGSFDPLLIRPFWSSTYPANKDEFLWVHPYFHKYSDHVRITRKWLYEARSFEGKALIKVCKLDNSEVLARRKLIGAYAEQTKTMLAFLNLVSARHTELSPGDCARVLMEKHGLQEDMATKLIDVWFAHGAEISSESFARALALTQQVEASASGAVVNGTSGLARPLADLVPHSGLPVLSHSVSPPALPAPPKSV
ncbi:HNH endonuclease [Trinickia terrae]|uniref:HNH endonuclease n=1 Tax=Trinickia terrae TaxID=2571161 RepID=A0A4U1I3T2_9BURK|nr:HNH endonuclease [Trinickia terrae]TKC87909.1 HNH endonuclease [Trinickia terrae]